MWPLEAKVLETPRQLAEYVKDVHNEYLSCRYAPFSGAGCMLGYLLSGTPGDALNGIEVKLGVKLEAVAAFPVRPHRVSHHDRTVPQGKQYPAEFNCHHLILVYPGLKRSRAIRPTH